MKTLCILLLSGLAAFAASVAAVVAIVFLGEARGTGPRQQLDVPGAITVTGGLAALVYAIVGTDQYSWGSAHTLEWLSVAVVLLGVPQPTEVADLGVCGADRSCADTAVQGCIACLGGCRR